MAIQLIAKIAPKNDGFTGMVDAEQVIGGVEGGTLPDNTIAESNVTQHEGAIDHTALQNIGTNTHSQIDDHISDSSDPHGATLSQTTIEITGDQSSADTAYVPMVLYNTDETPPTASNFPIGTIYIQYTA